MALSVASVLDDLAENFNRIEFRLTLGICLLLLLDGPKVEIFNHLRADAHTLA